MNGKIAFVVLIGFVIVFSSLISLSYFFPEPGSHRHPFYNQELNPDTKKIFFLGSSHVGRLNNTLISEHISDNNNVEVYNLAFGLDTPKERKKTLEKIILFKPEIIFYGVSYRDFDYTEPKKNILPDPGQINLDFFELDSINPKLNSLKFIRDSVAELGFNSIVDKRVSEINTPFSTRQKGDSTVSTVDELERISERYRYPQMLEKNIFDNYEIYSFKKIIQAFQQKNIKVVIFTTPLSSVYLESLSPSTKSTFESVLNQIKKEYDLDVYNFTKKYSHLPMWTNLDHISYNKDGMIYSKDIVEIIKRELEK